MNELGIGRASTPKGLREFGGWPRKVTPVSMAGLEVREEREPPSAPFLFSFFPAAHTAPEALGHAPGSEVTRRERG